MPTGIPITEELKKDVIEFYTSKPISIKKTANHFKLSDPTIIKILDEYKIPRHKKALVYSPNMNEHYFENIDTEAKGYYIGFLITDGNVFVPKDGRQSSISITQSQEDEYILQRFADEIGVSGNIGHDGRGCSTVAIRSDIMANDLKKYGICENKTLTTTLPILNDDVMPHVIRGVLDGDGNIKSHQTSTRNRYAHAISFCGTHSLMENIRDFLVDKLGIFRSNVYDYEDRHLSEVKWQSVNDMFLIGEYLYGDANIYLKRKYDKYIEFKTHYGL